MANAVQQLLAKLRAPAQQGGQQLTQADPMAGLPPATRRAPAAPGMVRNQPAMRAKNAATVYGCGGLLLYCLSFFNLASAEWFNGLVLLFPATALAYLAYRYMIQAE